jgi:hypothetical protein
MDKIEVTTAGIRSLEPFPPGEAILRFKTVLGQDAAVHIPPSDLRRLHALISDVIALFPLPQDS